MTEEKKKNIEEHKDMENSEEVLELSIDEIAEMQESMLALQAEVEEHKDNWMRAKADFINYKKRMEAQQVKLYEDAASRIVRQFLPILDDMNRALNNQPETEEESDWVKGVELIYQKFHVVLENEGITAMETEGAMFDPMFHEALSNEDSPDHESGQIIEEIQTGYMIGDRVLRHALVRVAS